MQIANADVHVQLLWRDMQHCLPSATHSLGSVGPSCIERARWKRRHRMIQTTSQRGRPKWRFLLHAVSKQTTTAALTCMGWPPCSDTLTRGRVSQRLLLAAGLHPKPLAPGPTPADLIPVTTPFDTAGAWVGSRCFSYLCSLAQGVHPPLCHPRSRAHAHGCRCYLRGVAPGP